MNYSDVSPGDLVLACAQTGDAAAWGEFVRRFQPLIAAVVLRIAHRWGERSPDVLDDLVQETYLKLCADNFRVLREFEPQHPSAFFGYIKVITANLVHDHFKSVGSAKRGPERTAAALEDDICADAVAPRGPNLNSSERQILLREIGNCLDRLFPGSDGARYRLIFWLYYRQGFSAYAISSLPTVGLSVKGVESAILRVTREVRRELTIRRTKDEEKSIGEGVRRAESF